MVYTDTQLKELVVPMLQSMKPGHEEAVADAIVALMNQQIQAIEGQAE